MASPRVSEALQQVAAADDPAHAFTSLLDNIKTVSSSTMIAEDLKTISTTIISSSLGVVVTRTILGKLISTLENLDNDSLWTEVGPALIALLSSHPSSASYAEQVASLCIHVATAYENSDDHRLAAEALAKVPIDSSQRRVTDEEKARLWIRIVRNYLEDDDWAPAETYLNKLKNIMHDVSDAELNLHFKLSAARIQDAKREFLAAAQSYHDISVTTVGVVAEEERLQTLAMAIKCAILAPAGPPRSRVLGRLYKDERSASLEEYGILEKIFLERLLAPAEVAKFAEGLQEHQLAITADGSTVLDKAIVEHNLLGVSRLYSNIGFDALGNLLGLDGDKAEETTARMIEQGRLAGWIDQIDRTIGFDGHDATSETAVKQRADPVVSWELRQYDLNVQALAEELEQVTNSLQMDYPAFVERNLVA